MIKHVTLSCCFLLSQVLTSSSSSSSSVFPDFDDDSALSSMIEFDPTSTFLTREEITGFNSDGTVYLDLQSDDSSSFEEFPSDELLQRVQRMFGELKPLNRDEIIAKDAAALAAALSSLNLDDRKEDKIGSKDLNQWRDTSSDSYSEEESEEYVPRTMRAFYSGINEDGSLVGDSEDSPFTFDSSLVALEKTDFEETS